MGDEDVPNVRSPERGVLIVGVIAGLLPFVASASKASYSTVNGEVVDLKYSDIVAQAGGAVAVLCGLIALAMVVKAKKPPMIAAAVAVMALGGFQLARGFGAFYKPDVGGGGLGRDRGPIAYDPPPLVKNPIDPSTCASQDECDNVNAALKKKLDAAGALIANERSCNFGAAYACEEAAAERVGGPRKDFAKALGLFAKGCELKSGESCNGLAVMYLEGQGTAKDPAKALAMLEAACAVKYALGCKNLAVVHHQGLGVPIDLAKSFEYAKQSCAIDSWDKGDAKALAYACDLAGNSLLKGRGVAEDKVAAMEHYVRACARSPFFCFNLAAGLEEGGKPDLARARELYKASCDDGNTDSCNNLGMMLYKGEGGPKDLEGAKPLWKRACDDGVELACKNLERK